MCYRNISNVLYVFFPQQMFYSLNINNRAPCVVCVLNFTHILPVLTFLSPVCCFAGSSLQHVQAHDHSITGVSLEQPGHPNSCTAHQVQRPCAHRCGRTHVHQQSGHLDEISRIPVSLLCHASVFLSVEVFFWGGG